MHAANRAHSRNIFLILFTAALLLGAPHVSAAQKGGADLVSQELFSQSDRSLTWVGDAGMVVSSGLAESPIMARVEALALLARMNAGEIENFGYSDWRIPTEREIAGVQHLLDPGQIAAYAAAQGDVVFLWPVRGYSTMPGFGDVAIFATNSVRIKNDADILSGDVIVNDASPGPTLVDNYEIGMEPKSSTAAGSAVKADSLRVKNKATVGGDAHYNDVDLQGDVDGAQITPLTLPVFPLLPKFFAQAPAPGSPDVNVGNNGFQVLPEGDYGTVTVGKNATLVLSGGTYNVESISTDKDAFILSRDATAVRVAGRIATAKGTTVGPEGGSGISASEIVYYVSGINGSDGALDSTPYAVEFQNDAVLAAGFYAPNGLIRIKQSSSATGAFLARDVLVENKVDVALDSYFFNLAPEAADDSATVEEGGTVSTLDSGAASVLANDSDPNPGDVLTVTTTPVSGPANGTLTLNADGTFSYTHDGSETTSDSFVYEVCDDGLPVECDTATVSITIDPLNDPPVANDDAATVDEGGTVTDLDSGDASVLDNDTDADSTNLTVTTTPVSGPDNGTLTLNADGTFSYEHDGGETTSDSFVYEVCDDGTPVECDNATVSITVNPVNDAPEAGDDSATVNEGGTVTVLDSGAASLLANDTDPDSTNLVVTSAPVSGPVNGTVILGADGTFSYTHDGSETTGDSFVYEVCDDGTPVECDTATVSIAVILVNDPPVAGDDSLTLTEGDTATMLDSGAASVLANDTDPDSTNLAVNTTPVSGPANGSLTLNADGTFSYTHDGSETTNDSFVYEVCDDGAPIACDTGLVTISVVPVNDPPVAGDDFATVNQGGTVTVLDSGATSLLANDTDADSTNLTVTATPVGGPAHGTVTLNADGTFSYLNDGNENESDSFVYEVCDDGSPVECDTATVNIVIALDGRLTVTKFGLGDGTVTSSPSGINCGSTCSAEYGAGTVVTLTAVPSDSDTFSGFSGDPDCADGVVTINGDIDCQARFDASSEPAILTVATAGTGGGRVTSSPAGIDCPGTCSAGFPVPTRVELDAEADAGSAFVGWTGDADCADGIIALSEDTSCTAVFDLQPATLTVIKTGLGDGTVTSTPAGIDCGSTCSATFPGVPSVTLTATPSRSSVFAGFSGHPDCADGVITPDADKTCLARFDEPTAEGTVTVSFSGAGSGRVVSSPVGIDCPGTCSAGFTIPSNVSLTPIPDAGSVFAGWTGDADCSDGNLRISGDISCTAVFEEEIVTTDRTLNLVFQGGGSGSVSINPPGIACASNCSATVSDGATVTLSVRPRTGTFGGWAGDCSGSSPVTSVLMDADKTCIVIIND